MSYDFAEIYVRSHLHSDTVNIEADINIIVWKPIVGIRIKSNWYKSAGVNNNGFKNQRLGHLCTESKNFS